MSSIQEIGGGEYLRLVRRGRCEYIEYVRGRAVVGIIAVTDDRKLLIVEQHRPALDAPVLALPAGVVGDEAGCEEESLAEAAGRELLEETGYSAAVLTPVCAGASAPGASSTMVHLFIAEGLVRHGPGGGVDDEDIVVHEVPLEGLQDWLAEQQARGAVVDIKLFSGLFFLSNR